MSEVTYCFIWNEELREPIEVISTDRARKRDAAARAGQKVDYYTVVIGDPQLPDAFLEVVWENKYIAVWFVDDDGRRLTEFGFRKIEEDQMFLTDFIRWQYHAGARADFRDAELIESFFYQPDGYARHSITDTQTDRVRTSEYTDVPVEDHWTTVPAFEEITFDWIPPWVRNTPPPKGQRSPTESAG